MNSFAVNLTKKEKSDFYKTFRAVVIPIAIQNVLNSSLGLIDTLMISSLGTAEIAGVTAGNRIVFFYLIFLFGVSTGAAVLTAQYYGAGDTKSIRRVLGLTILMSLFGALVMTVPVLMNPSSVISIITKDADSMSRGAEYLGIIGMGFIPFAIYISYFVILRSVGNVKMAVKISAFSIVLNTVLNYILIFGKLGFEPMGVRGAATATLISRLLEMMILVTATYIKGGPLAAKINELFYVEKEFVKKFLRTVFPVLGNEMIWVAGIFVYDIVFGHMGAKELAAIGIIRTIEGFAFFILWSLGSGAGIVLGNKMGAGVGEKVYEYVKLMVKMVLIISVSISIVLFLSRYILSGVFRVEPSLVVMISKALVIVAVFAPIKSINYLIVVGILRSGGDTVYALLLDSGGIWLVGAPLVFITGIVLKVDFQLVFLMTGVEEFVKMLFGLPRVISKKWIKNLTVTQDE